FAHPLLDPLEVCVAEGGPVGELEVVVEAVVDGRTDRDLHARIQLHHRLCEYVGGVVTDQVERLLPASIGEDLELAGVAVAVGERPREVAQLAVDLDRERRLRKSWADRRRRVSARRALRERQRLAVGKLVVQRAADGRPSRWRLARAE